MAALVLAAVFVAAFTLQLNLCLWYDFRQLTKKITSALITILCSDHQ